MYYYSLPNTGDDNQANIPEWFAPVVNIVGHVGPLGKKHDSGIRSFDVRCTSYNPEALGKYKSTQFMLRCFFDTGKRWESYEPPRTRTLVHIIGQLIGRYRMDYDEKPAVLITDFKALLLSGNTNIAFSKGATSPERTSSAKRRYGPKSSNFPVTPERGKHFSTTITSSRLGIGDNESPNTASASPISRHVDKLLVEEAEIDEPEMEESVIDSLQHKAKRAKTRKRGRKD